MSLWMAAIVVILTLVFIISDLRKNREDTDERPLDTDPEAWRKTASVETDIERKMEVVRGIVARPAAATEPPPPRNGRMDDTRYLRAVKEKADEIERIARERGLGG